MAPSLLAKTPYQIVDADASRVGYWMEAHGGGQYRTGTTYIGLERDGELVAATSYDFYNGASIFANIAIAGPITRRWLWYIFYYPFVELNCRILIGIVANDNPKSHRLCKRMGFKWDLCIPDADPSGALRIYTMRREDCRFLGERYGKA